MESDENPKKPSPKFKIIKDSFVNVCENTTAHALPNIFRSDILIIQIFWFLLFLAGIGFSIFYVYTSVYSYVQFSVDVSMNRYEKDIDDFPAVTICNVNPFESSSSTVYNYLKTTLRKSNLNSEIEPTESAPAIFQVRTSMKVLKAAALSDKINGKLNNNTSFSLDSMLVSCYFDGNQCNSSHFDSFYTFDYGNCFTFNSNSRPVRNTSNYGPNSGLQMEVFTGFPGRQDYFIEKRGLYVLVHNNSEYPAVKYKGLKIPVGYTSDISIKRTFYDRLPHPFSTCKEDTSSSTSLDSEFYNQTIKIATYSRSLCIELCIQSTYIIPSCNCSDPSILITDRNQTLCKSLIEILCVDKVKKELGSSDLISCEEYCPTKCDWMEYRTEINFSDYPTEYYYNVVAKQPNLIEKFSSFGNVTYERFKKSVLMVNIYYSDLSYTQIQESQSVTFEDVLGVIGGQMGLFLGCSFLTFFEPIEFLMESIFKLYKLKKDKVQKF